jgi:hypothetical protein
MPNITIRDFPDELLTWYERAPWLRAVIQGVPLIGGSADTLFAWRGAVLAERRFLELIAEVSRRVAVIEGATPFSDELTDERFVELFKIATETATASASAAKRKRAAALLAGSIRSGQVNDLSNQIARDLAALDEFHLTILAGLPQSPNTPVSPTHPPASLSAISNVVYRKGFTDLERFGFIRYDSSFVGTIGGGGGQWRTTEYMAVFLEAVSDDDLAPST